MKVMVMDYLVMIPEVNGKTWTEAKRVSMVAEGVRQCATTRIQAWTRTIQAVDAYRIALRAAILIQSEIRRARCAMRYTRRREYLVGDL